MDLQPSVAVLLGTSGTGKGTRVVQLIKFLQTRYPHETVFAQINGKKKQLGIKFPDINLFFVGMITTSNKSGLASWTSMDYIHSSTGGVEGVPELLKPLFDEGMTVVCEGEPMMQSNRWRPLWMRETYGIQNFNFSIFHYDGDREAYDARIVGRSGKEAGDSGWSRESQYTRTHEHVQEEMVQLGMTNVVCPVSGDTGLRAWSEGSRYSVNLMNKYDESLEVWGSQLLQWIGLEMEIELFKTFTEQKPMLRDINGNNPLATTKRLW